MERGFGVCRGAGGNSKAAALDFSAVGDNIPIMTKHLPLNTSPLPVKLRIVDYLLLEGAGAFQMYEKTELIDGEVYFMNAQHRPHALAKIELYDSLRDGLRAIGSGLRPMVEASVALSDHSAPEPDLVLTSEPRGPGLIPVASVALIVEVSDATLEKDRQKKMAIYARANIPEYWIADVNDRTIHQMWAPEGETYTRRQSVAFGQVVTAALIDGLSVATTLL